MACGTAAGVCAAFGSPGGENQGADGGGALSLGGESQVSDGGSVRRFRLPGR